MTTPMPTTAPMKTTPLRTMTLRRVFNAPRDIVFRAWTDPDMLAQWWGPRGFTNPVCEWNVRPGGKIRVVMRASDEIAAAIGMKDHPMGGEIVEIAPPSRLVFYTSAFEDEQGKPQLLNRNTVTFEAQNGKTSVTLCVEVENAAARVEPALAGMEQGWSESLDKLSELLAAL